MPTNSEFNPEKIAYYERAGWEAYYDRKWLRAFWLLVQLNREQFRMPLFTALAAALDIVRASRAFAPVDNDIPKAQRYLAQFFAKTRQSLNIAADAKMLADLEMDYWVVHRQLAVRRQQNHADDDLEPMIQAFARLHAALFNATPEAMRPSAEWRALAAKTVDQITGRYSTDVAGDWRQVEEYLRKAYQAVHTG
jgi:hypothetical protein